jgi:predicted nuclease of predicted toxin-antitoxin system
MMRFLADESCDHIVTQALRASGHDVISIAETNPGSLDSDILDQALNDQRILITEDRDFSELVFRDGKPAYSVILIRIPASQRLQKVSRINELLSSRVSEMQNAMITLTLTDIRIRTMTDLTEI